jgi:hypothetical protein
MRGRRLGKNFETLQQHWSGAVMCLCGVDVQSSVQACPSKVSFQRNWMRPIARDLSKTQIKTKNPKRAMALALSRGHF